MVRLIAFLFFTSLPFLALPQNQDNPMGGGSDEWNSVTYSQEDKIYNRSVWTFVDNPALAGFDRKLAFGYRFRMKNLAMGVPNDNGNLEVAFMKHEAFVDLPFGGPKQNWGLGLHYSHEKELRHRYHRVQLAQSHRVKLIKDHYLVIGLSFTVLFSRLDSWDDLIFGDMIDPRYGLVYPTNELRPSDQRTLPYMNAGLRYYWKRFSFDYSVQYGPDGTWALAGMPTSEVTNKLRAAYHFNVGDGVTISPEIVGRINTVYGRFHSTGALGSAVLKTTNNFGFFSAFATITYKDMVYGQLGIADLNRFTFRAGYQLQDYLVIEVGGSSYLNETMKKIAGPAGVQVGIRYQIKAWNR